MPRPVIGLGRGLAVGAALFAGALATACFDGEELTKGLPCENNAQCGGGLHCVDNMCGGPDEVEFGGDPCALLHAVCVDASTLGTCDSVSLTTIPQSCDSACQGSNYNDSLGCNSNISSAFTCYCDEGSASCSDTVAYCNGNNVLDCSGGVQAILDCDEYCYEQGQIFSTCDQLQLDNGTGNGCVCTSGTCSEGARFCLDDSTEIKCTSGAFVTTACTDAACATQLGCDFGSCPPEYEPHTLGCHYLAGYSDYGCACTS